jgi:hypothetical protein
MLEHFLQVTFTLSRVRGFVTDNDEFWIGWLDLLALLLQLQPIITVHNQWLSETRSIPYWTTSVFSSTVTDLVLIYESVTPSASVLHGWALNSFKTELRLTRSCLHSRFYSLALTMENVCCLCVSMENICCLRVSVGIFVDSVDMESAFHTKSVSTNPHLYRNAC